MSKRAMWILYDSRAAAGVGTEDAIVLVACHAGNGDPEKEARSYGDMYGAMSCYSYVEKKTPGDAPDRLVDERWEWDWYPETGFTDEE